MSKTREIEVKPELYDEVEASYSADRISEDQPVRKPFKFKGRFYISTGNTIPCPGWECYELVDQGLYNGAIRTYRVPKGREYEEYYESLRRDPKGFYHGMLVKRGNRLCVLVGPPLTFTIDKSVRRVEQPVLFTF